MVFHSNTQECALDFTAVEPAFNELGFPHCHIFFGTDHDLFGNHVDHARDGSFVVGLHQLHNDRSFEIAVEKDGHLLGANFEASLAAGVALHKKNAISSVACWELSFLSAGYEKLWIKTRRVDSNRYTASIDMQPWRRGQTNQSPMTDFNWGFDLRTMAAHIAAPHSRNMVQHVKIGCNDTIVIPVSMEYLTGPIELYGVIFSNELDSFCDRVIFFCEENRQYRTFIGGSELSESDLNSHACVYLFQRRHGVDQLSAQSISYFHQYSNNSFDRVRIEADENEIEWIGTEMFIPFSGSIRPCSPIKVRT